METYNESSREMYITFMPEDGLNSQCRLTSEHGKDCHRGVPATLFTVENAGYVRKGGTSGKTSVLFTR